MPLVWLHRPCGAWRATRGGIGLWGVLLAPGCRLPTLTPPTPPPDGLSADGEPSPLPPDSGDLLRPQACIGPLGLDRLGLTQAIGGLALGLIALFSSYDHLTIAGRTIAIPQQWGIPLIAASVAIIVIDAQLATGSRLREEHRAARAADERKSDRNRAEQRENEADRERNLAAEARERQAENLECIRQAAVLSARVQLDPSDTNRARLQTVLNLLSQTAPVDLDL